MKTQGIQSWKGFPSYLPYAVPRILEFLKDRNLTITVFVIGQDAVLDKNREAIAAIADAGHEIGNHSFNHEPWLHLYTPAELTQEFVKTEDALKEITGKRPVGFRGPGFSLSNEVLRTLMKRGYTYDGSTFPTYLGPLARAYTFFRSKLSRKQKSERKALFGSWRDGFQSNQPFEWTDGDQRLISLPVTTMPVFKVPIHGSYVLFLAGFSKRLAKLYFWMAIKLCRFAGVQPSLLLHPTDFLGCEDEPEMDFFPGMKLKRDEKTNVMSACLKMLTDHFEPVTMGQHVEALAEGKWATRSIHTAAEGAKDLPLSTVGS